MIEDQTFSIAENSANGTVVGTVIWSGGGTVAIISGNESGAFAMSSDGLITVADVEVLDFDSRNGNHDYALDDDGNIIMADNLPVLSDGPGNAYVLSVRVTNSGGTADALVCACLTNVDFISPSTFTIPENGACVEIACSESIDTLTGNDANFTVELFDEEDNFLSTFTISSISSKSGDDSVIQITTTAIFEYGQRIRVTYVQGDVGGGDKLLSAFTFILAVNNSIIIPTSIKNKLLFLWTGGFDGSGNLLSELDTTIITVDNKDFATSYIPATSAATFKGPASFNVPDTDEIWYRNDDYRRAVTVAELIGYDFARTIVKYGSAYPYDITAIALIDASETLTSAEINLIHGYFELPVFWSGFFNENGVYKQNRTLQQSVWVKELAVPDVVKDADTVVWLASDDEAKITKDGSNYVSAWADKNGTGHNLIQATGAKQPLWSATDGILFDGVADVMKASTFTLAQPETIYMVVKLLQSAQYKVLIEGNAVNTMQLNQDGGSSNIKAVAGSTSAAAALSLNNWHIIRVRFNGASSKLQVDANTAITGNFGAGTPSGMTLGGNSAQTGGYSNARYKEVIVRKVADTTDNEALIYNYLKTKYAL